ncbi:hypothetical protein EC973_003191 [Apophysomyces ossiformis]|uniref:Uncharacterized protein n=1 Tax=Apophysomyces ossiformis TaxID=679940 RepID=A0A8H7BFV0_9FUNG|nr:hypothetical protein EC973_003191 [Apophysomyces ossiformis]
MNNKGPPIGSIVPVKSSNSNLNYGILHLYRDANELSEQVKPENLQNDSEPCTIMCTLAVPSYLATPDFLNFVAPVDPFVSHYRIIRDGSPNKYMVLMKFRDANAANDYYKQYNGRPFSSMEPEICHVVYIKSVEINSVLIPPYTFPFLSKTLEEDRQRHQAFVDKNEEDPLCELPTCPVCLERMDENVTGLLTILCQHTFHCYCLSKWGDGSCPVCRYSQKPVLEAGHSRANIGSNQASSLTSNAAADDANECFVCGAKESLWICLICGHIGCGRYQEAHAYDHYMETNHLYALEIETQRVWDYAGDGYVHRLIQNMVDGKLVELPSAASSGSDNPNQVASQEKLDAMSLEYTYLLTSQLDSQRIYYEDHLTEVTAQLSALTTQVKGLMSEIQNVKTDNEALKRRNEKIEKELVQAAKEKEKAERRLETLKERYETSKREYLEEKEMTSSLLHNNEILKKSLEEKQQVVKELGDQVRDLMFFLEARDKVQDNPEMEGGSVETRSTPVQARKGRKGKRPV